MDDDGRPLLIDPSAEDPFEHLLLSLSVGDVCQAMLRQGESPGAAIVFGRVPEVVPILRDPLVRGALLR